VELAIVAYEKGDYDEVNEIIAAFTRRVSPSLAGQILDAGREIAKPGNYYVVRSLGLGRY
jgi:hypothetical protein